MKSVKIKNVYAPEGNLLEFDPGFYISQLEFYETEEPITESDRESFANFLHYLAYLALSSGSTNWANSTIQNDSTATLAITSHFAQLDGFKLLENDEGINYKSLVSFLMGYYKPKPK